jgi:serine/threonine protein kinase/WD40 repeat protein
MRVRVLGDIAVAGPGARALTGPAQRRTFALLIANRGETVSVDRLVDACWPHGDAPEQARHNMRTYVHRIRSALGDHDDRITTTAGGYRLELEPAELDADLYERLAGEAARLLLTGDVADGLDRISEAEALWRGHPFAELADEPWARAEVTRIVECRVATLERRAEALLEAGRSADAIGDLERLTHDEPYRERPRALLMRALYESGRQAEALRAFQEFRRFLIDDAGIEPSRDLVDLDRRIAADQLGPAKHSVVRVGNYELHERIGEGAFAVVHRATQSSLGREVAIKIVRAELADRPEFIRRFEAEAHMVAAIEHPHVVPLYDYWREPGRAFLVMRWMTGGSLETRLDGGPLDLDETVALVDQIADALDAAHAHDIVHRDVKPANILFDDQGRAYLGDFGIALSAEERSTPQAALSEGSPVFASPEQLRREPAGPESDVHALGVVAFTALTGRTPFHDSADANEQLRRQLDEPIPPVSGTEPALPGELDDVLAVATAKRAGDRYPTAGGFALAFRHAALGTAVAAPRTIGERINPYRGLRPFTEADSARFHGRARLIDELVAASADPYRRLLSVVGPSGSGKSSLVRAGLVPALRSGRVDGSAQWFITTMIPGSHPYEALETALLRVAVNPPSSLLDQLRDGERGIHRGVSRIVPDAGTVLVVIDQFEELFTTTADAERQRFLRALATAVTEPGGPLRVVVTMRADFFDQPLRHPEFAPLFKESTVAITPLAPDELEEAITVPAAAVGVGFEPGLIAAIVADVNTQPGALPLLQYALTQTFDAADGDVLTTATYHRVGGLTGALARRAESLYSDSDSDERRALRQLLGRLVTLGEGTEHTRRRVRRSELPADPATLRIVERFGAARLLTFDHDPATREPTIEIAHEALIREWPRLRAWLDDDRDALRLHRHLTEAAAAWIDSDRDEGELYRGGRLDAVTTWASGHGAELNVDEREFLEASTRAHEAQLAADRERFEAQVRSNHRLRTLTGIVTVVAVIAAAIGVFALRQRWRAESQAALAADSAFRSDVERLVSRGRTASSSDPTVDLLLAVEAHRLAPSFETTDALHWALTARPGFMGSLDTGRIGDDITVVHDGRRLVTHTVDDVQVWDVPARRRLASWPAPVGATSAFEIHSTASTDGALVAVAGPHETLLHDGRTGDVVARFEHDVPASSVELSPDSTRIAIGFEDGVVSVHRLGDGSLEVARAGAGVEVNDLAWLPAGDVLVVADELGLGVWRPTDERLDWHVDFVVDAVLVSSDGARIVVSGERPSQTGDDDAEAILGQVRAMRVLDATTGESIEDIGTVGAVRFAWTDERETEVVGTSFTGPISRYDLDASIELPGPGVGSGRSEAIAVLTDPGLVAVAGTSTVELLTLDGSGPLSRVVPLPTEHRALDEPFLTGSFDESASSLVTAIFPMKGSARRYDLRSDELIPSTLETSDELDPFAIRRFGDFVLEATGKDVGLVVRSDVDGPIVSDAIGFTGAYQFALSPRGDLLAAAELGGRIVVLDVATGARRYELDEVTRPDFPVPIPEFTPDGRFLHVWNGASAHRFDAESGESIWSTEDWGYVFPGPDDEWVAAAEPDGTISLLDPETLEPIGRRLVGHRGQVKEFYLDEASGRAVTVADDGTARIWDTNEAKQLGRELPANSGGLRFFAPGARLLANPGPTGYTVWNYDTDSWPDIACQVVGRNLTRAEWESFGPRDADYRATCEQYPIES